jgi:hypothetical protein
VDKSRDLTVEPGSRCCAAPASSETGRTLLLGALFGGWYLFNIYFNMCAANPRQLAPLRTGKAGHRARKISMADSKSAKSGKFAK